jgi:hypothetical protein
MPLPGVTVTRAERGPVAVPADDVGGLFAVGVTERGPVGTAVTVRSFNQFRSTFGDAVAYSTLSRPVEAYFREGGTRVVVSRVVGPDARAASRTLVDSEGATVLTVAANGPGGWGNSLAVAVVTGTDPARTITITRDATTVFSATVSSAEEAQDALNASGYVVATLGAGDWPVVASASAALTGGDDRYAAITDTQWTTALDLFTADLGAGSVAAPGRTTTAMHKALFAHARERNRFALADAPDTATVGTLVGAAAQLRATDDAGYGQLLAPWEEVTIGGVTIAIPPSASQAGRLALADRVHGPGPGQPAAGQFGLSVWSTGVTQAWGDAEREQLNDAGVTVIRGDGQVRAYGARTLADPNTAPQLAEAAGMRVAMAVHSQAAAAMERHVMETIDGGGRMLAAVGGDLVAIAKAWYMRGALFGANDGEAYLVDVGASVNPPEQLALRRVSARIELRTSPFAERIVVTINKLAAGDAI